ncbi:MAG: hypothetical protein IT436_04160, partial [Phycisphaerales bacterium]|nr:hypothetical protein [Phycisphaerales bacterium]
HRITGTGRLFSEGGGTLTNFGTLLGNRAGGLHIDCPVANHAVLRAVSPGGLSMRGMVEQFGPAAFVEGDGADVTLEHNSDINGGVVRGVNGGVVTVAPGAEAYLSNVTSEGEWVIPSSVNTTLVVDTAWTNNGLVRLAAHAATSNSVLQIDTQGLVIHGTGEVRLEESFDTQLYLTASDGTVTNGPGHTISGVGRIYGGGAEFRNQGTLSPGAPLGTLSLQTSAVLEPTSVLRIEVGDDTDILDAAGWSLTLGGTLKVELRDGVELAPCTELYVVRGDLSGTFDTHDLPVMPQGLMHVVYLASEVKISYIPGDLNGDGLLDFADYLEFLNLFDAQDPRADLNGDGLVDFGDYLEFLNLFNGGC